MKTCSKCKIEKDEAEFSKNASKKDGLDYRCKLCLREYQRTDSYKEARKAYRQTDAFKKSREAYEQTDVFKASQKAYRLRKKAAAASAGNAIPSNDTQTIGTQE